MYEVENEPGQLVVNCVLDSTSVRGNKKAKAILVKKACGISLDNSSAETVLKSWKLKADDIDINKILDDFDSFINREIPHFENNLETAVNNGGTDEELYTEGTPKTVTLTKYERNPQARAACLAAHGTACAVCGIDFGKFYGPEFAGKIEVHHIVPISEIGAEYKLDPIKDLVPVCPNCHMALHSKKDGVYTVEELKSIRAEH